MVNKYHEPPSSGYFTPLKFVVDSTLCTDANGQKWVAAARPAAGVDEVSGGRTKLVHNTGLPQVPHRSGVSGVPGTPRRPNFCHLNGSRGLLQWKARGAPKNCLAGSRTHVCVEGGGIVVYRV